MIYYWLSLYFSPTPRVSIIVENINQLLSHKLISRVLFISLMNIFLDSLSNTPQSTLGEQRKVYVKNVASTNGCLPYSPEKVIYKG